MVRVGKLRVNGLILFVGGEGNGGNGGNVQRRLRFCGMMAFVEPSGCSETLNVFSGLFGLAPALRE